MVVVVVVFIVIIVVIVAVTVVFIVVVVVVVVVVIVVVVVVFVVDVVVVFFGNLLSRWVCLNVCGSKRLHTRRSAKEKIQSSLKRDLPYQRDNARLT